jgi:HK97 family phage portal protein
VDGGNAIAQHNAAFFQNMSRPSGYLKVPGTINPDGAERLRTEWTAAYKGADAGRIAVLQSGLEWVPLTMSAVDAAVVQSYKMANSDIARVFRVPLAIVGDENAGQTRGNTEILMKNWLATGLGYILEHVELALDHLFELPPDEWIAFDRDYLLQADFAARIEGLVKGVQGAVFSPNEARAREGLPAVEHGDQPRVQQQVVPLSYGAALQPPNPTTPAPASVPEPEDKKDEKNPDDEDSEDLSVTDIHLSLRGAML